MVFRHISKDIKEGALWLLDHDYIPKDVCDILGISGRDIQRWTNNQAQFGSVIPPPPPFCGHPHILNPDATHDLVTLVDEAPEMFLDEIQDWLAIVHEVDISRSTLL